jgi:hypothetical protein
MPIAKVSLNPISGLVSTCSVSHHSHRSTTFDSLANAEDVASLAPLSASMSIPSTFGSRREGESARDHELYKNAAPREDGLYHCPWEGEASCTHKPEKLKCNYE